MLAAILGFFKDRHTKADLYKRCYVSILRLDPQSPRRSRHLVMLLLVILNAVNGSAGRFEHHSPWAKRALQTFTKISLSCSKPTWRCILTLSCVEYSRTLHRSSGKEA